MYELSGGQLIDESYTEHRNCMNYSNCVPEVHYQLIEGLNWILKSLVAINGILLLTLNTARVHVSRRYVCYPFL